jgi:hypothetical protein
MSTQHWRAGLESSAVLRVLDSHLGFDKTARFLVLEILPRWGAAVRRPYIASTATASKAAASPPHSIKNKTAAFREKSDAPGDVREIEPDFYAAEVRAFGADGCGDSCAEVAWRADVAG